jgi:hypothetical protein
LSKWLELHVIPDDVLDGKAEDGGDHGEKEWDTMVPGRTVRFVEQQDGSMRVMPGDIAVDRVDKVSRATPWALLELLESQS